MVTAQVLTHEVDLDSEEAGGMDTVLVLLLRGIELLPKPRRSF